MTPIQIVNIAHVAHEANRAYCAGLGDRSQPAWDDAPEWQRQSAVKGVVALIENPLLTSRQVHDRWCDEKYGTGWSYGPVKNAEAKTHPCLVPYSHLPPEQQVKDRLFRAVVQALVGE